MERTCRDRGAPSGLMRINDAIAALLALMVVLKIGFSAEKPITTWVLDKERSFSNPPGLDQMMRVAHSGDVIKLDGKQTTAKGETAISETYTMDGKEVDFTPAAGPPGAKGKRKSFWLADGRSFVDTITTESPAGSVPNKKIASGGFLRMDLW